MNYPNDNEWKELEDLMESDPRACAVAMGIPMEDAEELTKLMEMKPWTAERYINSDIGNACLMADYYADEICYVPERKCWHVYTGGVWLRDDAALRVMHRFHQMVRRLDKLSRITRDGQSEDVRKRIRRLHTRTARETILRDMQTLCRKNLAAFDAQPWLLNCRNGVLDLKNMLLLPHSPDYLMTIQAPVRFDPTARNPRWERFVEEIMCRPGEEQTRLENDETREKARYLQKVMGLSLTGDTSRECMFMLYGPSTRNGKGTLTETMMHMLGGYARSVRPETLGLTGAASGSAPSEDLARLRGARFASVPEPDYGLKLNVALIKRVTGNDTIAARMLYENTVEYRPEFKVFVSTNHRLQVSDPTLFSSGRLKTITFERHFAPEEQDPNLKASFEEPENLSAVLNWCLDGLQMYLKEGLQEPKCLRDDLREYEKEADLVAQFMEECLIESPGAKTRMSAVYQRYQKWCVENGEMYENSRWFKKRMSEKGKVNRGRESESGIITTVLLDWKLI